MIASHTSMGMKNVKGMARCWTSFQSQETLYEIMPPTEYRSKYFDRPVG